MNNKEPNIDETIKMLAELSRSYEKALECSNEVISMKNKYIVLCEQEKELHRKENLRLQKIVLGLFMCLGGVIGLLLFML